MNMNYTAEELAFRDEVRAFLDDKLPADIAAKVKAFRPLTKDDHQRWQKILSAQAGTPATGQKSTAAFPGHRFRSTSGRRVVPLRRSPLSAIRRQHGRPGYHQVRQ